MAEKIVVTSLGILSALGKGVAENLESILAQNTGLHYPVHLQTVYAKDFLLGEVRYSNNELSAMLGLPQGDNGYTRTTLLALVAVQELLQNIDKQQLQDEGFAFINA